MPATGRTETARHHAAGRIHSPGRIHSIETFGTVDGPGIRFVLFMQGCALRCQFCHNPDSWEMNCGRTMTVEEVLTEIEPYLTYYKSSGGGLTVSGGEPTLQAGFVTALFRAVKERWGLHTALDTSGYNDYEHIKDLLSVTDLVLLDLKHIQPAKHLALTGQSNERILRMAKQLSGADVPVWIRHVLVPGRTDAEEDLLALGRFIGSLRNVRKFELLPYHVMGIYKWQELGIPYELAGVVPPDADAVDRAVRLIERGRTGSLSGKKEASGQ